MTHEPECIVHTEDGCMGPVALAYQRGVDSVTLTVVNDMFEKGRTLGYREGYNDHARSRAYAEQVYGPYPKGQPGAVDNGDGTVTLHVMEYGTALPTHYFDEWNQHGKGENP